MDFTPKDDQTSHMSSSFDASSRVFESTPKTEIDRTLYTTNPKKRKAPFCDIRGRRLDDSLDLCPSTPCASSTLNESLSREFENIKIERNYFNTGEPAQKFMKTNGCERIVTPPSTPESHFSTFDTTPRKTGSYQKCSSSRSVLSPLKEQHEILYPTLAPLDPPKKPLTPQKFKIKIGQNSTPFKRSSFNRSKADKELVNVILRNDVVMSQIFKYLSNGDLFRVSMVSTEFRNALERNRKAYERWLIYRADHKRNKENYKITPPSSPESQNLFPDGSVSPNSKHFSDFVEMGSCLNPNQSLTKCPKCGKPSVVDSSIAQCQDSFCGYIFCQKCDSFSYHHEEFEDKCRGIVLLGNSTSFKGRSKLEDLTNCSPDFNGSAIFNSTADYNYHSSGYYSGYDSSHTPQSVKRNLSMSFGANEIALKPQKALFDSNRSVFVKSTKQDDKRRSSGNLIPTIKSGTVKKRIEIMEPSSPPKVKTYAAGSKESKRNLKRLTR